MAINKANVEPAAPAGGHDSRDDHGAASEDGDAPRDPPRDASAHQAPPQSQSRPQQQQTKPFGWNIRDLAEVDADRLLQGRVYRCSQVFNKEAVLELRIRSAVDLRKAGRRASRKAKRGDNPQYSVPERHSDSSAKSMVADKARHWREVASRSGARKQEDGQQPASRTVALSEPARQRSGEGVRYEHEVEADSHILRSQPRKSPFGGLLQQQQARQEAQAQRDTEEFDGEQQRGGTQGESRSPSGQLHQGQQQGQSQQRQQQQRRRRQEAASGEQPPQQGDEGSPMSSAASRAAGAQRSISERRATGSIGPRDIIAGIGDAAAEAGRAVHQAGGIAKQAGGEAADAAGQLKPRPNRDGGFDLALGKSALEEYGIRVYQVELLPPRVKLLVFWRVPARFKWRTITACCRCASPQSVMAPVVADRRLLGYVRLYCLMLDKSKPYMRRALAVFADEGNLPAVAHCTHGKDRTGLLCALLALLCGVDEDAVVADYERSESNLKADRNDAVVQAGIDTTMVRDDVIASPAGTMRATLQHLRAKYGNIEGYLKAIKLSDELKWAIRENLLRPEALERLPHDMQRRQ